MTGDEISNNANEFLDEKHAVILGLLADVEEHIPAPISASMRALVAECIRQKKEGGTLAENKALTEVSRHPSQANLSGVTRSEPTS
jgi:hypothetical protein